MLNRIGNSHLTTNSEPIPCHVSSHDLYKRNELDDVKKAIEYLYEFKEKLSKLNPIAIDIIEKLLQKERY